VTKLDDSGLDPADRQAVEGRAKRLLDRASAWEVFPTPINDILDAAKLKVAPTNLFDPEAILAYLTNKTTDAARWVKSAVSKVFGVYDSDESLIHIDNKVVVAKQNFLKLHETGHHELPTHRKVFRFFQDCGKTLDPEIADQFEREANNFARFALFQGDAYARYAADCEFGIKTPITLAKKFGASNYASAREFARTNRRACVVYVLEPIKFAEGCGAKAEVRRIEASPTFIAKFGVPSDTEITLNHALGPVLPIGRKMTSPRSISIKDRNGDKHECLAEAFDTKWNIIILMYPVRALTATTVILPPGLKMKGESKDAIS
jgi:hypothetical protein